MILNTIKTFTLLALLSGLCVAIGSLFGNQGMQIAFIFAMMMNGIMYFFSDKIVLNMYNAKPLPEDSFGHIHDIIQELTDRIKIPKPKLWLVTSPQANAFATGRNPANASVALTTGILEILDTHELKGVLAHELSHIANRDILISTIAATLASVIGYFSYGLRNAALWGSYTNNNNNNRKNSYNPIVLLVAGLLLPLVATLLQLAISRSREYQADQTGAHITHEPLALASALKKLALHARETKDARVYQPAITLGIANPAYANKFLELLSTHPPIDKRVARLEDLQHELFKKV